VYTDHGDDHVQSALRGYSDPAPYEWLLGR
jgi:hypothetical protein